MTGRRQLVARRARLARGGGGWWLSAAQLAPAVCWALAIVIPVVYLVLITFRTRQQYSASPLALPESPNWDNYVEAWNEAALPTAFFNNFVITLIAVVGVVVLASIAAFGLMRWRGRFGGRAYVFFVLGLIVPFQLGLPALYRLWGQLGLVDSLAGTALIHIGAGLPLAVFLYSGFLLTVPRELEEAATVDGAGDIRTFVSIVFPLLTPVTATVVILTGISVWNDLLVSLFFLQSPETQTLTRATLIFTSAYSSNTPVIFACAVLAVIPMVALFVSLQRFFMSGLMAGALRG